MSSLAFALETRRVPWEMQRVIYASPTQKSSLNRRQIFFVEVFGDAVIEGPPIAIFDPDHETVKAALATENCDDPP
jgi:hypothetical protein